ncbi:Putative heme-dependent peroxidase [bacterium HR23]|nr:Putative heme-dependent peroxidase [bacterium HR23]
MSEERALHHFTLFRWTARYWSIAPSERRDARHAWWQAMQGVAPRVYAYQVFPARADAEGLLWCAQPAPEGCSAGDFFHRFARGMAPVRGLVEVVLTLWGFTRPSQYAGGRSPQEIDPFNAPRKPYLVVYPFSKTTDWYLMSKDARQGMMNEHIRLGRQFPQVLQLLAYSTGLQDQEFVVAYETDDLAYFSELVAALRSTDARRYTLRDTPIITATYRPGEEALDITGG